jgi:hypothetical protein
MKMHKIISVAAFDDFTILIKFNDGIEKIVNIKPLIGKGVSSSLEDLDYFKNVRLTDGFIHWDNGFDFCPNFLYQYTPQS